MTKYLLILIIQFSAYAMEKKGSYFDITTIFETELKQWVYQLTVYDRDGVKLQIQKLYEKNIKMTTGLLKGGEKPRPVKAVIGPHLKLGRRALGFFDQHNNLVGKWRSYAGNADLFKENSNEKNRFSDMDLTHLQCVEERGGSMLLPTPRVITYLVKKIS